MLGDGVNGLIGLVGLVGLVGSRKLVCVDSMPPLKLAAGLGFLTSFLYVVFLPGRI